MAETKKEYVLEVKIKQSMEELIRKVDELPHTDRVTATRTGAELMFRTTQGKLVKAVIINVE